MSGVQSVERALVILRALSSGPAGVTELSDRVHLAKSTVSRMLSTLEAAGAVEQLEGGGPYRLGPLIAEIAAAASSTRTLIEVAQPLLAELANSTGEVALIAVPERDNVRFMAQTTQHGEVQVRDWSGTTSAMHVSPSGLVWLAFATAADVDDYLGRPLEAYTPRSVVDPARIRARLAAIREVGYAWVHGEFSEEINSTAAPVRDVGGRVVACVNLHGPSFRFPGEADTEVIARRLVETAERISVALGRRD